MVMMPMVRVLPTGIMESPKPLISSIHPTVLFVLTVYRVVQPWCYPVVPFHCLVVPSCTYSVYSALRFTRWIWIHWTPTTAATTTNHTIYYPSNYQRRTGSIAYDYIVTITASKNLPVDGTWRNLPYQIPDWGYSPGSDCTKVVISVIRIYACTFPMEILTIPICHPIRGVPTTWGPSRDGTLGPPVRDW